MGSYQVATCDRCGAEFDMRKHSWAVDQRPIHTVVVEAYSNKSEYGFCSGCRTVFYDWFHDKFMKGNS